MADEKKVDTKKDEDLTPQPTQEQLDGEAGKEARKQARPREGKQEDLTPTPTQAELDEMMAKLVNAEVKKREPKAKPKDGEEEDLTPTLTQEENDLAKLASMPGDAANEDVINPHRGKDKEKRTVEPATTGTYQTRAAEPARSPTPQPAKPPTR